LNFDKEKKSAKICENLRYLREINMKST